MARKLFGTDGVRGRANDAPMTPETALRLGQAAGRYFTERRPRHRVLIGKDTRRSGYMIENALTAGFTSVGMDVFLVGPVPDARRRHARPLDARRPRGDDLRLAQPLRGQRHQVLRPRRLQALRRRRGGDRGAARGRAAVLAAPAHIGRATRIDDAPRPLHGVRQDHLPARPAPRRPQGRRRLRQRRGLPHRPRGALGARRRGDPARRRPRRLQHQPRLRLDPHRRRRRRGPRARRRPRHQPRRRRRPRDDRRREGRGRRRRPVHGADRRPLGRARAAWPTTPSSPR